jgi:hypothetical protein
VGVKGVRWEGDGTELVEGNLSVERGIEASTWVQVSLSAVKRDQFVSDRVTHMTLGGL